LKLVFKNWLENDIQIGQPFREPRSDGHGTQITIEATDGDEIVGTIELEYGNNDELFVGSVYVNPSYRKQRINSKLHSAALKFAHLHGKILTSGMLTTPENKNWWRKQQELGNAVQYKITLGGVRYILNKCPV
jgi:GNAT superfamily N-acetyltransferase